MCGLHSYGKCKEDSTGATYFHSSQPLQEDLNVIPLSYIFVTINFIDTWIKTLGKNIACRCLVYQVKMKAIFQKILQK